MGVLNFVAKRIGLYLAVLFIGLTITFMLPRLMPINPVDGYIGQIQSRATKCAHLERPSQSCARIRAALRPC